MATACRARPGRLLRCRWPALPEALRSCRTWFYGIGPIDASGCVADRAIADALGWRSGDRLTLTAEAGVVAVRRDPHGMVTLPASRYIVIPAALRHRCGLTVGDMVLLAARPGQDTLAAYPFAVVDQAIRAHLPFPRRGRPAMTAPTSTSQQAVVEAALLLLERMSLSPWSCRWSIW